MAKMVKGSKRYILLRGKDEEGNDIVIDMFSKKELNMALKEGRVAKRDHVVQVQVVGRFDLKRPKKPKKA